MKDFFYFNDYIINNLAKEGEFPNNEFINAVKSENYEFSYIRYRLRSAYCSNVSWAFLTEDFIKEVVEKFKELNIKKAIDVFGGTGAFSYYVKKVDDSIDIISYTVENDSYFNVLTPMKENNKRKGILKVVRSHKEFYDLIDGFDCIIASWIPYELEDAEELLLRMNRNQYILVITEGEGGCIANDKFHNILDDERMFRKIYEFNNLLNFEGIRDRAYLYRKLTD